MGPPSVLDEALAHYSMEVGLLQMSGVTEGLGGGGCWADAVGASPTSQSTCEHAEHSCRPARPETLKACVQRERGHCEESSSWLE